MYLHVVVVSESSLCVGQRELKSTRVRSSAASDVYKRQQDEVVTALQELNNDAAVHGILPLMPMPKHIDTEALIDMLDPKKDIDGLTTYNIGLVTAGKGGFAPCTAKACMAILNHYDIPVEGKHVVVIGRSQVIGKPVALMTLGAHGTVTVSYTHLRAHET